MATDATVPERHGPDPGNESHSEPTPDEDTAEVHQLAALNCLSQAVKTADPVAFVGMLAFAFFEVTSDGTFGHWQRHLRGARSLLDYHCHTREEFEALSRGVTGLSEMMAYFCWWDTTGAVIRRLTESDGEGDHALIFLDWHRDLISEDLFTSVGCSPETFQLFVDLAKTRDGRELEQELDLRDRAIGHLLQLGLETTPRGRCRDAWRCAAAIAVFTWPGIGDSCGETRGTAGEPWHTTVQCAVERICHILPACSSSSRFYAHMAKPAFLAAMHTASPQQCRLLSEYWRNCQAGGFPRYSGVLGQCEEIWRSKGLVADVGCVT